MDHLVVKRNTRPEQTLRKPLMISVDLFDKIQDIAKETGYVKGALSDLLVDFALKRLVIEDTEEE